MPGMPVIVVIQTMPIVHLAQLGSDLDIGVTPHVFVTDTLRSYGAALKVIGNVDRQETARWLNNRAENSHQPFRRRERAMLRFRRVRTLQKFVAVHASVHNHFNQERHLYSRSNFKLNRAAALTEWRGL
jgi:putative transposase